jgi:hypothetical protein
MHGAHDVEEAANTTQRNAGDAARNEITRQFLDWRETSLAIIMLAAGDVTS